MPRRRKLLTARRKRKVAKLAARQRRAAERSFIRAVENFGVIRTGGLDYAKRRSAHVVNALRIAIRKRIWHVFARSND
jgi:hypothetical protein